MYTGIQYKEGHMSRPVRVLALAPRKYSGSLEMTNAEILDDVIRYWDGYLSNAFALKPDLIVLPEACDRPNSFPMNRRLEYYEYRMDKVRDHFLELAVKNQANIAYSAARLLPDGTYRNSTQLLSRRGVIDGIYDKNYRRSSKPISEESAVLSASTFTMMSAGNTKKAAPRSSRFHRITTADSFSSIGHIQLRHTLSEVYR